MNEETLDLWRDSGLIKFSKEDLEIIRKFIKLMDKHSLWLYKYDSDRFFFTNDADHLNFKTDDIKQHIKNLENGIAFPWTEFDNK